MRFPLHLSTTDRPDTNPPGTTGPGTQPGAQGHRGPTLRPVIVLVVAAVLVLLGACGADEGQEVVAGSGDVPTDNAPADNSGDSVPVDNAPIDNSGDGAMADDGDEEPTGDADGAADAADDEGPDTAPPPPAEEGDAAMEPIAELPDGAPGGGDAEDGFVSGPGDGWMVVPARDDLSGLAPGEILDLGLLDDRTVQIRFEAIGEGCSGATARIEETDTEVRVELLIGLPPEAAVTTCMNEPVRKELHVALGAPIGTRSLVAMTVPADSGVTPERTLDDYIGLPTEDAMAKAELSGRPARVVRINGEPQITTDDFIARRLNLEIVDNVVVGLTTDAGEAAGDTQGL